MKIFLSVLILIFNFQSWTKADDIKDFEIEGMSVGDSLLDYVEYEAIMERKRTPYDSKKFASITGFFDEGSSYDGYLVHFKSDDPKFIIEALQGVILYKENIEECYQMKKIITDLDIVFKNAKKETWTKVMPQINLVKAKPIMPSIILNQEDILESLVAIGVIR